MKKFIFYVILNGCDTELTYHAKTLTQAKKQYNNYLWDFNIDACTVKEIKIFA